MEVEPDGETSQAALGPGRGGRAGRRLGYMGRVVAALVLPTLVVAVLLVAEAGAATAAGRRRPKVYPDVPVTPMDLVTKPSNNSPQLAVDPKSPQFVVIANRRDGPTFGCGLQVSGDGGRTWLSAVPVPKLPPGADTCYAPETGFDGHGRLYYLFVGLQGPGNSPMGAFITTSSDRGATFTPPRQVLGAERYMVRMAIDPEVGERARIHLVWLQTASAPPLGGFGPGPNPIMSAYSDDGAVTFSAPVRVSDAERERVVAPAVALGPHHTVQVLYYDLGDDTRDYEGLEGPRWEGMWSLVVATSGDGGRSFDRGVVVDPEVVPPERVMLVFTMPPAAIVAGAGDRVYAAWDDARNGDWDVFLRTSGDGGRTWVPARRVNDDPVHDGTHQYQPHLSVSPSGRLDAVFYDRRSNVENRGNDVYLASSVDGGRSFARNVALTSLNSDSHIGPRYAVKSAEGLVEFGSRTALVPDGEAVLAAWTDTRNEGRGFTSQDVFATRVDFSRDDSGLPWLLPAAAAAAVGGIVLAALWARRRRAGRRRRTGPSAPLAGGVAALLVAGGCGAPGAALPGRPPIVGVSMREMRFDFAGQISKGRVVFRVDNAGTIEHRLIVVPLPEDFPPLAEELKLGVAERRLVSPLAGIPDLAPGERDSFAVDLSPGRYAFVCLHVDPDGVAHANKGMGSELRVE